MADRSIVSLLFVFTTLHQSTMASIIFEDEHANLTSTARPKFSRYEIECFKQGKVLYEPEGKCYKLLEVGPCREDGEWLVLDQEEVVSGSEKLKSVCRRCICCGKPYRAVYWPADGQCHRMIRESNELCPSPGTILQIDPFGEGECACKKDPPHAQWNARPFTDNGACYPLYQRGPCNVGEIFVASDTTKCKRDTCSQYNQRNLSEMFVEWEGNGKCYKLGSKGPCQGELTTFNIHPLSRRPACVSRVNQIVDLPPNCDTDQNGKCREEIELPSDSDYISDLLNAAQKKRSKRRTKTNKQQGV